MDASLKQPLQNKKYNLNTNAHSIDKILAKKIKIYNVCEIVEQYRWIKNAHHATKLNEWKLKNKKRLKN